MQVEPADLRVDLYTDGVSSGFVLKRATTVRITHLPTGLFAECSSERSEWRNRTKALAQLKEKLEAL